MKYFIHYLCHLFVDKVNAFRGSAADHLFASSSIAVSPAVCLHYTSIIRLCALLLFLLPDSFIFNLLSPIHPSSLLCTSQKLISNLVHSGCSQMLQSSALPPVLLVRATQVSLPYSEPSLSLTFLSQITPDSYLHPRLSSLLLCRPLMSGI